MGGSGSSAGPWLSRSRSQQRVGWEGIDVRDGDYAVVAIIREWKAAVLKASTPPAIATPEGIQARG
jgi:hypothetical protein